MPKMEGRMAVIRRLGLLATAACTFLAPGIAQAAFVPGDQSSAISPAHTGSAVIKRDAYGAPTIYADDTYSLFYGYGYALAEDRLFQIESVRRALIGRSAEVFGPDYIQRDIASLTNFDPEVLRPQVLALTGERKDVLDGMTAGINARIREVLANRETLLPKQFSDYGFEPQFWTSFDIATSYTSLLFIGFADNSRQTANLSFLSELTARHGAENGRRLFDALRWLDDPAAPTTVQREDQLAGRATSGGPANARRAVASASLANRASLSAEGAAQQFELSMNLWGGDGVEHVPLASNAWAANGARVSDADAVLIAGPQVGDQVPSMIWAASLRGAGLNVTGSTYPGLPYFHFGTNGDIAWTRTALAGTAVDIFELQLDPRNPHRYRYNGRWRDMEHRTVSIPVKGQDAVSVDLYRSVHGPVLVFDEAQNRAYSKRRTWEANVVDTMFAYYDEMKATNYDQWSEAIFGKWNNQSQYFADSQGNIAYIQAGRYAIRHPEADSMLPTPGDGSRDWRGLQNPRQNARVLNPAQQYIANWNNRPSPDIPNSDSRLWSAVDRVDGLIEQFEASASHTTQQIWDFNRRASWSSEQFRNFQPLVTQAIRNEPQDSRVRQLGEAVVRWDGQQVDPTHSGHAASSGQAIYYEWLGQAETALFRNDLPEAYLGGCGTASSYNCPNGQSFGAHILYFALTDGRTGSPRLQYDLLHGVTADALIRAALIETDRILTERYQSADIDRWLAPIRAKTWTPTNPRGLPWAGRDERFSRSPDQNRGTMNALFAFRNGQVSMCDSIPPGQSGFISPDGTRDPNYANQLDLYTGFGCRHRPFTEAEITASTVSERRLAF